MTAITRPPDWMVENGRFDNFVRGLDAAERTWQAEHGWLSRKTHAYRSPHDFVRQHGEWFEISVLAQGMAENLCYHNSILLSIAQPGWKYVEGFTLVSPPFSGPSVVQHAWAVDPAGDAYETTWPRPGHAYLGVVFAPQRADEATWHGDATTLDDDQRGWPLLRKPWRGEDYSLTWQPSPVLDLMRNEPIEWVHGGSQ